MAEGNGVDQDALAEMLRGVVLTQERILVALDRLQSEQERIARDLVGLRQEVIESRKDVAMYHGSDTAF